MIRASPVLEDLLSERARDPPTDAAGFRCEREAGSATLRIAGRDQLGFLAFVLAKVAACELEPFRISLRTQDGVARDRFVLLGRAGTPAKSEAVQLLARMLAGEPPGEASRPG